MLTHFVISLFCSGTAEYLGSEYGAGDGEIWLENLECTGEETTVLECNAGDFGENFCWHFEDVSISCSYEPGIVKRTSYEGT